MGRGAGAAGPAVQLERCASLQVILARSRLAALATCYGLNIKSNMSSSIARASHMSLVRGHASAS
jgi:hypothetical protein